MDEQEEGAAAKEGGRRLLGASPRLYERAIDTVADRVKRGILPTGAQITESMLAEQLGIGRAPARRALVELEGRGVVERSKGRGYRVLGGEVLSKQKADRESSADAESVPLLSLPSWERIYGEIENEIVARIPFGDWRVNEMKLARHYLVSRTVARDVVGRLQQQGLLRKDESSRWIAPALSHRRIGELYEVRAILEPVALIKAVPKISPALLEDMRAKLEAALPEANDIVGATLDGLEQDMHVTLLQHCGNLALMQAITLPQSLLIAHRFLYRWTPRLFAAREPFLLEHLEIVGRLQEGDAIAAADALKRHLLEACGRAAARVDVVRHQINVEDLPYLEPLKSV